MVKVKGLFTGACALICGLAVAGIISLTDTSADVAPNFGMQRATQYIEVRNDWADENTKIVKREFFYDDAGYLTDWSSYSENSELLEKSKFKYNDSGYLTEWTSYDENGKLLWKRTFEYDRNGYLKTWKKSAN